MCGVPVVFDTHHYDCYCQLHPQESFKPPQDYMADILATWEKTKIKPKFHVSEQGNGRVGHHSDYIETIPFYLMEIPARAFFFKKEREVSVKIPKLILIPTLMTSFLTILLFFCIEPFQDLTSMMVGKI